MNKEMKMTVKKSEMIAWLENQRRCLLQELCRDRMD